MTTFGVMKVKRLFAFVGKGNITGFYVGNLLRVGFAHVVKT